MLTLTEICKQTLIKLMMMMTDNWEFRAAASAFQEPRPKGTGKVETDLNTSRADSSGKVSRTFPGKTARNVQLEIISHKHDEDPYSDANRMPDYMYM